MERKGSFWITNATLEHSFAWKEGRVAGTQTERVHVQVKGGRMEKIVPASEPLPPDVESWDARGLLMLPSFREMHIHLDKTYYGGPWQACIPASNRFFRIEQERELLPKQLPVVQERAEKLLDLLQSNGATHVRTHCNIDPVIGLQNLEATLRALETYSGKLSWEMVAFPQHGLLRSKSVGLMREALRNGAGLVGGVDPATFDEDIEKSLNTVMDLAVEADADIDLHLHEPGHLGVFIIKRIAALTEEAGWQGRVTISHAYGLGEVPESLASEIAEQLVQHQISIVTAVPIDMPTIPVPLLDAKGVRVSLGNDNITDHWDSFGTGDMLQKANRLAERFRWTDEVRLSRALGFVTGGVTPLDDRGNRVWPQAGDSADAVFVQAGCSAEAVARQSAKAAVLFQGKLVWQSEDDCEK
ncbi:amidohydrolase family protein [Brevibacillus choshinensis]|uniref:Amidohydrolase family protein n=1 Tax=Brevibacillus choshinensis TaxID=54911 RepID=A0ABX7FVY5_BRECH|nr:amidohydrolase family protein [Brevibacillus choshinensis]QRG69190.1 amidohydrolase family protein [Brevibacillus choshinensis]